MTAEQHLGLSVEILIGVQVFVDRTWSGDTDGRYGYVRTSLSVAHQPSFDTIILKIDLNVGDNL